MLAGEPPFTGTTPQSVIAKRFGAPAPSVAQLREAVPAGVEAAVAKALSREPDDRFATARDFAAALASAPGLARATRFRRPGGWRLRAIVACAAAGVLLGALWYRGHSARTAKMRWVTREAIPLIRSLADSGRWDSAYGVATRAAVIAPHDSALVALWPKFTDTFTIQSDPPGARVYRKSYSTPDAPWALLGITPLASARLPFRLSRIRLEKEGRRPVDAALEPYGMSRSAFVLDSAAAGDTTMVRVPGGEVGVDLPGLDQLEPIALGDFLIGRHEVTNRAWKQFVEQGGYRRKELWKEPFVFAGRALSWEEAMARFTDRTGRPGPATWEAGDYPTGQADYPVTGVSWYEAEAYAAFAGTALPTIYHWSRAAHTRASANIVPLSNFRGAARRRSAGTTGWDHSGPTTWPATSASGVSTRQAANVTSWAAAGTTRLTPSTTPTPSPRSTARRPTAFGWRGTSPTPTWRSPNEAWYARFATSAASGRRPTRCSRPTGGCTTTTRSRSRAGSRQ